MHDSNQRKKHFPKRQITARPDRSFFTLAFCSKRVYTKRFTDSAFTSINRTQSILILKTRTNVNTINLNPNLNPRVRFIQLIE